MEMTDPDHDFYREFLRPYYVVTREGQYLFGTRQKGRRPDRVFYMVPDNYRLGTGQRSFDHEIGAHVFSVVKRYVEGTSKIVQNGVQGERDFATPLRVIVSVANPHAAYMAWMGKLMIFPPGTAGQTPACVNYIVPERLPPSCVTEIREVWPEFDPDEPLTLFDLTGIDRDVREVLNLRIDYFGGAYKKPNLTMAWNRAEERGFVSYHAGCTDGLILKGLSGTGKTTLTVGSSIYQDDALVGIPKRPDGRVLRVHIVGLEAASFAKSEGLTEKSPEWAGLMKSREGRIVLAMNIDCAGVSYETKTIAGHDVVVPVANGQVGSLRCTEYTESGTTNGRVIFQFSDLNSAWGAAQRLRAEGLSFRRFDILEPIIRVTDPRMAVALDSACESVITSAVAGQPAGSRVRSYAATDFMAREQAEQAVLKLKIYEDMGLAPGGGLIFFVVNTGYVGKHDMEGGVRSGGEKITVADSKKLISLVKNERVKRWIAHPAFGYLIPDPQELERRHGMGDFCKRFNPLRYYAPDEVHQFIHRDSTERTAHLKEVFAGQRRREELEACVHVWETCTVPPPEELARFYRENYG
jgi:hypothetical protein